MCRVLQGTAVCECVGNVLQTGRVGDRLSKASCSRRYGCARIGMSRCWLASLADAALTGQLPKS